MAGLKKSEFNLRWKRETFKYFQIRTKTKSIFNFLSTFDNNFSWNLYVYFVSLYSNRFKYINKVEKNPFYTKTIVDRPSEPYEGSFSKGRLWNSAQNGQIGQRQLHFLLNRFFPLKWCFLQLSTIWLLYGIVDWMHLRESVKFWLNFSQTFLSGRILC